MPCDKLNVIEEKTAKTDETKDVQEGKDDAMSHSTLVLRRMPEFKIDAYDTMIFPRSG